MDSDRHMWVAAPQEISPAQARLSEAEGYTEMALRNIKKLCGEIACAELCDAWRELCVVEDCIHALKGILND